MKNLTTGLIALAMIIMIGLGCSKSDTTTTSTPTPSPSPSSNDNKASTNSNPNTPSSGDIVGSYSVSGKSPNGQPYSADLTIKKQDEVYQFSWNSAGRASEGVGIQGGNLVAAGFTNGTDGKGCGAAIYKIGETSMEGKFASWGFNNTATQTATLVSQTKTSGIFNLDGTDSNGTTYKDKLVIKQNGDVYQLAYGSGKGVFYGTGIRQGDYLAVGVGKPSCGFAVYEIKDGKLAGIWGGIGVSKVGTEIAARK